MPRSRSRSFESITRSSTCWCAAKVPDCCSSLSTSVVLPWSTWAMMAMLRRLRIAFPDYLQKKGIIPGIKVDKGLVDLSLAPKGEKVSQGLDDLSKRLDEYFKMGCRFAKWRSTITISDTLPTHACLYANAHVLAR